MATLERKPIVYISNFVGHDYSDAEQYGELVRITEGYVSFGHLDRLLFELARLLDATTPEDYLLMSGNNILTLIIGSIWLSKHGTIRLLIHDKKLTEMNGKDTYRRWKLTEAKLSSVLK